MKTIHCYLVALPLAQSSAQKILQSKLELDSINITGICHQKWCKCNRCRKWSKPPLRLVHGNILLIKRKERLPEFSSLKKSGDKKFRYVKSCSHKLWALRVIALWEQPYLKKMVPEMKLWMTIVVDKDPANKLSQEIAERVVSHIEKYNPSISHYRQVHAPKWLYISPEYSVSSMHKD